MVKLNDVLGWTWTFQGTLNTEDALNGRMHSAHGI